VSVIRGSGITSAYGLVENTLSGKTPNKIWDVDELKLKPFVRPTNFPLLILSLVHL
jgi:hypothetical protein